MNLHAPSPLIVGLMQGAISPRLSPGAAGGSGEPNSYVTPLPSRAIVPLRPASEFANYVVAHAEYSSPLGRRAVLSGLVAADSAPEAAEDPVTESLFAAPRVPEPGALPAAGKSVR